MTISDLIVAASLDPRPFSSREARRVASDTALEAAVARGDLVRVLPALYAAREHSSSWQVRALSTCAWMPPGGALTGRGALFACGAVGSHGDDISLVVPRNHHRRGSPWMNVVSQTHPFSPQMVMPGLTVAPPELALIHAYRWESSRSKKALVYEACAGRMIDPGAVRALMGVLPRVPGRRALDRLLENAARGVESFLEERADVTVLTGEQFDGLVRQHRLTVGGESFRVDAYDPVTRTAIEFDGASWHSTPEQQVRDKRRDAMLASVGILTVRFAYTDVIRRPAWCRTIALNALASRRDQRIA